MILIFLYRKTYETFTCGFSYADSENDDVMELSDDDPFNASSSSSSRKPAPTKKSAPKSRGITFDTDSDEDIMPAKKKKR